jgi:hypothetical protein
MPQTDMTIQLEIPEINMAKFLAKNGKEFVKAWRMAVARTLARILLPAPEGLPTYTSMARSSFEAVAREYGLADAGPYIPHPEYPEYLDSRYGEGGDTRITLDVSNASISGMEMEIPIDHFLANEFLRHNFKYPQKSQPWKLLLDAKAVGVDYLRTAIPLILRMNFHESINWSQAKWGRHVKAKGGRQNRHKHRIPNYIKQQLTVWNRRKINPDDYAKGHQNIQSDFDFNGGDEIPF